MSAAPPAGFWRRRVRDPIVAQLRQGTTPRQIAATISTGVVVGIFPVLGTTTVLCALIGMVWRLNQPVIQLVNYLAYPLQIALLFPFYRAGEKLFGQPPVPLLSITELNSRFWAAPAQFFVDYGLVALYGITVWALLAVPLAALLYLLLSRPLQVLAQRVRTAREG